MDYISMKIIKGNSMDVIILGAGIAGLSSAIALAKQGISCKIFERQPSISHLGAGIVCWPNACFVLDQLDLLHQVSKHGGEVQSMQRLDATGELLGVLDISKINQIMGYPSISITRHDLTRILYNEVVRLGLKIHFEHEVIGFEEDNSQGRVNTAHVIFSNNKQVSAELIIGADGRMNSPSRQYVLADNKPKFQHFINWIGVFESQEKLFTNLDIKDYWGNGERFGIVPINANKAYWAGGKYSHNIKKEAADYKAELLDLFASWPSPIDKIIKAVVNSKIHKLYIHDHNPIKNWHKNNVLLIGDAAHAALPTSGQGACQALEDAWHLSLCLSNLAPSELESALNAFIHKRTSKTESITYTGRHLAKTIFTSDKAALAQRNLATSQLDYDEMAKNMGHFWSQGLIK